MSPPPRCAGEETGVRHHESLLRRIAHDPAVDFLPEVVCLVLRRVLIQGSAGAIAHETLQDVHAGQVDQPAVTVLAHRQLAFGRALGRRVRLEVLDIAFVNYQRVREMSIAPHRAVFYADDLRTAAPGEVLMDFGHTHFAVFPHGVDDGMRVDEFRKVDLNIVLELRIGLLRVVRESHGSAPWVSPVATGSRSECRRASLAGARAPDRVRGSKPLGSGSDRTRAGLGMRLRTESPTRMRASRSWDV